MSSQNRSLVFQEGSSNKFWKIELSGSSHTVHFGKVGTNGQSQTKDFDSEDEALKSYNKLVAEKLKKGYADDGVSPASAPTAAVKDTKTTEKKAASRKKEAKSEEPTEVTNNEVATTENEPAEKASPGTKAPATKTSAPKAIAPVNLHKERSIALKPEEWAVAKFRPQPRITPFEPRPFNLDACVQLLSKSKPHSYGWEIDWSRLDLPLFLSKEESEFWLWAMTENRKTNDAIKETLKLIEKNKVEWGLTVERAIERIAKVERTIPNSIVIPFRCLFGPVELVQRTLDNDFQNKSSRHSRFDVKYFAIGFNSYVLPTLTDQERTEVEALVKNSFSALQPPSNHEPFEGCHYLAASLGMHNLVRDACNNIPTNYYSSQSYYVLYHAPDFLLCGLGSSDEVVSEWRRLAVDFYGPQIVREFLACTEYRDLNLIADYVCKKTSKDEAASLLKAMAIVKAPEAAEPMLRCKLESKSASVARDWLDENVEFAVQGLLATACGRTSLAEAAIDFLRSVKRRGLESLIVEAIRDASPEVASKIQSEVIDHVEEIIEPLTEANTPEWLKLALATAPSTKKKAPAWAIAAELPPLSIEQSRLNDAQVAVVIQTLMATDISAKHPLLIALRENISKHARDAFAWKMFQFWCDDGCASKEKWAMGAIGQLGDDGCVMKLTPMIRVWPGESQHQRAVFGLECLRAIGSNVALMQLSAIAQKLKFKGLKTKAEQFISEIAKEKGMSRDELEDRVVPDCGLDDNGKRIFSFGSRSFSFVLGGDLKAMVRDDDGKVRTDLPKPSGKDDAAIAEESLAEWKLMKKQIKEVATIQARRLENSMITGRRWKKEDFEALFVQHPLMTHLAQKLVWATFDQEGKLSSTFRITEEKDFASVEDDALELTPEDRIGLVHPLQLSPEIKAKWGEVLSDYEIVTPFAQLGREIFRLSEDETGLDVLRRYDKLKIVAPTLVFTLEKLGWIRGLGMDGGCFDEHSKQFPAANLTAVVNYEGTVGMGYIDPEEELTLDGCYFVTGMREPSGYGEDSERKVKLGKVDEIVISEVLADLELIKNKAK